MPKTNTEPMSDDEKRQAFIDEYNYLCKKHGLNLAASPALVQRDDGTYSIVIQWSVVPIQKQVGA